MAENNKVASLGTRDSRMWTTEQMLEGLLADVRAGKIKPNHTIVLMWESVPDGRERMVSRYVNLTNVETFAYLARAAQSALNDWKENK
jgi:hypothetical protein